MSTSRQGRQLPVAFTRMEMTVEMRENGWLQPKTNDAARVEIVDFELISAQTKHVLSHGEKVWRALVNAAAIRNGNSMMFPVATNGHVLQPGVTIGNLTPLGPDAYMVGSAFTITVDAHLP